MSTTAWSLPEFPAIYLFPLLLLPLQLHRYSYKNDFLRPSRKYRHVPPDKKPEYLLISHKFLSRLLHLSENGTKTVKLSSDNKANHWYGVRWFPFFHVPPSRQIPVQSLPHVQPRISIRGRRWVTAWSHCFPAVVSLLQKSADVQTNLRYLPDVDDLSVRHP